MKVLRPTSSCVKADRTDATEIGQEVPGGGIVSPIGGIAGMNMVRAPVPGAPIGRQKIEKNRT